MGAALMGGATSCDDFEEINFSPSAAGESYIHPDYALNKNFFMRRKWTRILQNVFVYNWASITRIIGDNTMGSNRPVIAMSITTDCIVIPPIG